MNEMIQSPQNPQIKAAIKLRQRRGRTQQGLTIIDGLREIERALASGFPVRTVFLHAPLLSSLELQALEAALERQTQVRVTPVSLEVMNKLAFGQREEGAVALAQIPHRTLADVVLPENPLIVVAEQVEKPGNLGAVLRSMDAVGANLLISADGRTDLFNPNAIRSSMGTIFSLPAVDATTAETLSYLRAGKFQIVAARVDGSVPYTHIDLRRPTAIVLGSEARGISGAWQQPDVTNIHLPMRGIADSLNVSSTAAVLLYEALRQREG